MVTNRAAKTHSLYKPLPWQPSELLAVELRGNCIAFAIPINIYYIDYEAVTNLYVLR